MKTIKTKTACTASILLLGLIATPVWAAGEQASDIRMEVVSDPDAGEAEYVDEIELPEAASDTARDNAAFGIDTANEARTNASEDGRAFGESVSREARDAGNAASARGGAASGARDNRPVDVGQ